MDTQNVNEQLAQKSDHELLVTLVLELQSIRRLLEAGQEYNLKMDESRSGAWGATYSGTIYTYSRQAPAPPAPPSPPKKIDPNQPLAGFSHMQPWLSENVLQRIKEGNYEGAIRFVVAATWVSPEDAEVIIRAIKS